MAEDLITPENLSKDLLESVFSAAYMDVSYDSDGDLRVKDDVNCFVLPSENKDRIALLTMFGFKSNTSHLQRLECVNQINSKYIVIRAIVGKNDILRFEYDILVTGGITRKALVMAVKRFCSIPRSAIADLGADLVE